MVEHLIVCNCGNTINYSSEIVEEKIINCNRCGKQIKILHYSNNLEVHFI
jgi:DNA-directed RNA polymerase subunit RPC12/RpoP